MSDEPKSSQESQKPYILRAIYEWVVDRGQIPHLLLNPQVEGVDVPQQLKAKDTLVLNLSMKAANNLSIMNEGVTFNAAISGRQCSMVIPMKAIIAIYGKDDGQGIIFGPVVSSQDAIKDVSAVPVDDTTPPPNPPVPSPPGGRTRGHLTVVK